jgi:glycosyltransferase involved in cell wall biosynthesis
MVMDRHEMEVDTERARVSACVIAYNRRQIIETCLSALGFADEVLVVDKSSTDGTTEIARRHADRVLRVPWSPTVEETRGFAIGQCRHDWILLLDDDECLSVEAVHFVISEMRKPRADVYLFPRREYVLGLHDERAYYWPQSHVRLFRREAVEMHKTVHAGTKLLSESVYDIPPDDGICIHHLSHADAAQWMEKTNRYTSRQDRLRVATGGKSMVTFAQDAIHNWTSHTPDIGAEGYPEVVALLRAIYDIVDRVKIWEEEQELDGSAMIEARCRSLRDEYRKRLVDVPCQTARSALTRLLVLLRR